MGLNYRFTLMCIGTVVMVGLIRRETERAANL